MGGGKSPSTSTTTDSLTARAFSNVPFKQVVLFWPSVIIKGSNEGSNGVGH